MTTNNTFAVTPRGYFPSSQYCWTPEEFMIGIVQLVDSIALLDKANFDVLHKWLLSFDGVFPSIIHLNRYITNLYQAWAYQQLIFHLRVYYCEEVKIFNTQKVQLFNNILSQQY
eukprot:UN07336